MLLSEKDEYKNELAKYNKHLEELEVKKQAELEQAQKLEEEKTKTLRRVIKTDSAKIQTGKSFASLLNKLLFMKFIINNIIELKNITSLITRKFA